MGAAEYSGVVVGCPLSVVLLPTLDGGSISQAAIAQPDNRQPTTDNRSRFFMCAVIAVLAVTSVLAQSAGKLRLMIDPGAGYQFVLDKKYRMQQREVELSTGPHHFTF